jgi:hypothetical protein
LRKWRPALSKQQQQASHIGPKQTAHDRGSVQAATHAAMAEAHFTLSQMVQQWSRGEGSKKVFKNLLSAMVELRDTASRRESRTLAWSAGRSSTCLDLAAEEGRTVVAMMKRKATKRTLMLFRLLATPDLQVQIYGYHEAAWHRL